MSARSVGNRSSGAKGRFRVLVAGSALALAVGPGAPAASAGAALPPARAYPAVERVANPYAGGTGYVNPLWKARADAEPGGTASAPRTATDARRIR
jgi:hypothetical protein